MRGDFLHGSFSSQAMFFAKNIDRAVLDKLVGPADAHDWRFDAGVVEMLDHRAAKTVVQHVIFNRANHIGAAREKLDRPRIERLDPAWIDYGSRDALRFEHFRRF